MPIIKRMLFAVLLLAVAGVPISAQQMPDKTYTFRFVADNDMFYVPWNGNGTELDRLISCVEQHKAAILDGEVPVLVDGHCTSQASEAENLAMAKIRSNRVKSELILRGGLTEACFTTKNHATEGNFVTVRIIVPSGPSEAELEAQRKAEAERLAAERAERDHLEQERLAAEAESAAQEKPYAFALHANLLRWATLSPDLGVEWRISRSVALTVNGTWTSWSWDNANRRYALWEVAPEVRYYLGKKKAWYVGAMFKGGQFNYKLSDTGKQGDLIGGGLSGGYRLKLNNALALDVNIGLGCLNADYQKYEVIDGVRVNRGTVTKNWWGPINAGVNLVWSLF